jgi:hypothetical protein
MQMALRRLRTFVREGVEEELDLDATIDATSKNAGELEVITRAPKRPNTRVVLMMDVGGSMEPYRYLVSRLFTAARKSHHFRELNCYYFHNCVYGKVYRTENFRDAIQVPDLLREHSKHYKLILVGDAYMAPYELMMRTGHIAYEDNNSLPGIGWLMVLQQHFKRSIWLNPESTHYWQGTTIEDIRRVFPMYPLTLDGLSEGLVYLNKSGHA